MIYEMAEGTASYPTIQAEGDIGFAALSALAASDAPGMMFAASDSFLSGSPSIYTIDATTMPARITAALTVIQLAEVEVPIADYPLTLPDWVGVEVTGDPAWRKINMLEALRG
jgi:hypothetical protein